MSWRSDAGEDPGGGWAVVVSHCFSCGRTFGYNPHRVPSIPIGPDGLPAIGGERKPICRDCVLMVNPLRVRNGLEPIEIFPDSYEPIPASELGE
jgi:hypothetical protein